MNAAILLLSLKGVEFEKNKNCIFGQSRSYFKINSGILDDSLQEYSRIKDFVNDSEYPEYLKEDLKKAVIEKFNKYIVRDNLIETSDGCTVDILSDDLPF